MDRWQIKHFVADELVKLSNGNWEGPNIVPPPVRMLDTIEMTIKTADEIRDKWGAPIRVNSGYRPPLYNKLIGGSDNSAHMYFFALDLYPINGQVEKFHDLVVPYFNGEFEGDTVIPSGLGLYDWGVHIDVGKEYDGKPLHRRWDNRQYTKAENV